MAVTFCPIFNGWQGFTPAGLPLIGGLVNTYLAGTSTPAATYTTSAGNIANSNPIQLGADGRPPAEIWLTAGQAYKFVLTDSAAATIATYDNITGIVNAPTNLWIAASTPTYVNATQFTVSGDQTLTFVAGLRIQYTIASTQYYGSVLSSSFGAGVTTVTAQVDVQPFTGGLNALNISQLTPNNTAVPTLFPYQVFTPIWFGLTTSGVTTYTQQTGYGVRIGNSFFFHVTLVITGATGTGTAQIGGFPYNANTTYASRMPITNTGAAAPMMIVPTVSGAWSVMNSTSGAAIAANSPAGYTYSATGFFPL